MQGMASDLVSAATAEGFTVATGTFAHVVLCETRHHARG